jgi:hypothetical protein
MNLALRAVMTITLAVIAWAGLLQAFGNTSWLLWGSDDGPQPWQTSIGFVGSLAAVFASALGYVVWQGTRTQPAKKSANAR